MRFDDTLETVLAGDLATPYGAQSAWRQVVDLIGRRRAQADARAMSTLRSIRDKVPVATRASTARALESADPPAPLVRLFALDDLAVALPVLRSARLRSAEWIELLPDLAPAARSVLRNRRDLGPVVARALESFGPVDFVLTDESARTVEAGWPETAVNDASVLTIATDAAEIEPESIAQPIQSRLVKSPALVADTVDFSLTEFAFEPEYDSEPATRAVPDNVVRDSSEPARAPVLSLAELLSRIPALPQALLAVAEAGEVAAVAEDYSFVALAGGAAEAPASADALHDQAETMGPVARSGTDETLPPTDTIALSATGAQDPGMDQGDGIGNRADAADIVEIRLADDATAVDAEGPFEIAEVVARIDAFWRDREENGAAAPRAPVPSEQFRFETDAKGVLRWVDGVSRSAVIGVSLDVQGASLPGVVEAARIDGIASGAFRRRAGFSNARLSFEGESDAAGDWLISGVPVFDTENGRFTGYRGTARRPRPDERAEPARPAAPLPADSLRQLVHELRTPTNAIAGFAEMIETQMLGPVAASYRDRANIIRAQAKELLGAIDDLDLAARIDSAALALVPGRTALRPLLAGIAEDLAPLVELRGSVLALPIDDVAVSGDRRAVERLLSRLLATLVSASVAEERIAVDVAETGDTISIGIDRPKALADYPGDSVLGIDDEREDETLLGTGFALRLARNLARELGGSLAIEAERLTLRLPAAVNIHVGQAKLN